MTRTELLKTAKPILFNSEMVRAILDGRKTVTRRCVKPKSKNAYGFYVLTKKSDGSFAGVYDYDEDENAFDKPQKQPAYKGDILYVRETWFYECHMEDMTDGEPDLPSGCYSTRYVYKASNPDYPVDVGVGATGWRPSIHMPKEAARIFLRVTDVRVERLQEITEEQVYEEGWHGPWCAHYVFDRYPDSGTPCEVSANPNCPIDPPCDHSVPELFGSDIWDKTVKKSDLDQYGWAANPWVWVIEFEKLEVNDENI